MPRLTMATNYPRFVQLLELMRADNGEIFLDTIEHGLAQLPIWDLDTLAYGDEEDQRKALERLDLACAKVHVAGLNSWASNSLDVILAACFDGVRPMK